MTSAPLQALEPSSFIHYHAIVNIHTTLIEASYSQVNQFDDPKSVNWTLINEMTAALTQKHGDAADWKVANTGKLPMPNFEVGLVSF